MSARKRSNATASDASGASRRSLFTTPQQAAAADSDSKLPEEEFEAKAEREEKEDMVEDMGPF